MHDNSFNFYCYLCNYIVVVVVTTGVVVVIASLVVATISLELAAGFLGQWVVCQLNQQLQFICNFSSCLTLFNSFFSKLYFLFLGTLTANDFQFFCCSFFLLCY